MQSIFDAIMEWLKGLLVDGICRVNERLFTKSIEYEDINYQLAQADDQSAIFDGYCAFLNSFDSTLPFQLSFLNHRSRPESKYTINIPLQEDAYNGIRQEFVEMLEGQIAKKEIERCLYEVFSKYRPAGDKRC